MKAPKFTIRYTTKHGFTALPDETRESHGGLTAKQIAAEVLSKARKSDAYTLTIETPEGHFFSYSVDYGHPI